MAKEKKDVEKSESELISEAETKARSEAKTKEEDLSVKLKCKVNHFIFKGDKTPYDWLVGFIKEPTMLVKARAMDKMMMGQGFSVGGELVEACLIKEETDPRIYSALEENANYVLGSWKVATDLVAMSLDQSKKK